jgi:2-C-methyl-D-erythritol 4-phosphate cytidylyltransferase
VIVASESSLPAARVVADAKAGPDAAGRRASVVAGGPTRQSSARLGLAAVAPDPDDVVLVHDAARPLADAALIRRVVDAVLAGADGAVPVVPVVDTIAVVEAGLVTDVGDRARQRVVQTPQGFRARVLEAAHRAAAAAGELDASDDGGLVLRHVSGSRIAAVAGDPRNIKVTVASDLERAAALLGRLPGEAG